MNLNGYTKGARNEIFAMQPAPIQVSYMGFPGTTGANYIDYLVTDEFVSPTGYSHIYSEKLVHLPHCYFVNDYKPVRYFSYMKLVLSLVHPGNPLQDIILPNLNAEHCHLHLNNFPSSQSVMKLTHLRISTVKL
ncbi:hypothetical protein MKX01_030164 [Papaver californicum]|nr:hypothetical protein MKX01_030164 [Papaver californicum]